MGVKKIDCYLLTCDGCGHDFEYDYIPHFETELRAYEYARDVDGCVLVEDLRLKVYCENCTTGERFERGLLRHEIEKILTKGEPRLSA